MNAVVKPPLVNQPSAAPTRKLWAGIITGMIVSALRGGLNAACEAEVALACAVPDLSGAADGIIYSFVLGFADFSVGAAIVHVAEYFTRDRAKSK